MTGYAPHCSTTVAGLTCYDVGALKLGVCRMILEYIACQSHWVSRAPGSVAYLRSMRASWAVLVDGVHRYIGSAASRATKARRALRGTDIICTHEGSAVEPLGLSAAAEVSARPALRFVAHAADGPRQMRGAPRASLMCVEASSCHKI